VWLSLGLAGLGILLAYAIYSRRWLSAERLGAIFQPFYKLFSRKYWLDELYETVFVKNFLYRGLFAAFQFIDSRIIDGLVNALAGGTTAAGRVLRRVNTGQLQLYGLLMAIGVVVIAVCLYVF